MDEWAFLDWVQGKAKEFAETGRASLFAEIGVRVEGRWGPVVRSMVEMLIRMQRDGQVKSDVLDQLLKKQMEQATYQIDRVDAPGGANIGNDLSRDKTIDGQGQKPH